MHQHIHYTHSSSSNSGSSPGNEVLLFEKSLNRRKHSTSDDKLNKNLCSIQVCKEYKEALMQQRRQEISSVYEIKVQKTLHDMTDRQREDTELMTQLRNSLDYRIRLKMTLPEDIASALTDGVLLCHLANYVRPRSVASIHVPSPGVSKLTMALCRRNVELLEACLKIGVDENLICCAVDVLEGKGAVQVAITVCELFRIYAAFQQSNLRSPTRVTRSTMSPSPIV